MREGVAKVLDDDDHEFVDLLHSLGVQRNVAKVTTYLAVAGESTSRDILSSNLFMGYSAESAYSYQ